MTVECPSKSSSDSPCGLLARIRAAPSAQEFGKGTHKSKQTPLARGCERQGGIEEVMGVPNP